MYYTLNGNNPDSHSAVYTEPFDVTNGCTLKVYATKPEYFDSAVVGKKIEKAGGIGETMGDPNQVFTTDGSGGFGWTRVVDATAPNGVAMKSGAITHSQSSVLSTTVTGPGTLTFSWRTSCEEDELHEWDHAEFVVDGTVRLILDGITGWRNESVAITGSGTHTVEWRYVKDNAESDGEDAAWAAGFRWEPVQTATQTTQVPVPYAWLRAHDPTLADEYEAYEAAAKNMAANGHKVWECYVLGLDPQVATSDFRIVSFPMKADGTPDWTNVAFDPPQERWNVPDAPVVWKGAAQLEGPWRTVSTEDGSPGTTRPTMRFFKAVVFGDVDDEPDDPHPSVQLWEGGPYWATKNIGAEKPWEYGYYFWWGDTVGYTNMGSGWISVKDGIGFSFADSGMAISTYGKDHSALLSAGYIDATGNLAPEHDAAHVHWGGGWRMPTVTDFFALVNNCTTTWITTNGVSGQLVTGKGDYANRSIFLPAAGVGCGSKLTDVGSWGFYWSSTPTSSDDLYDGSYFAEYLGFFESDSDDFSGDFSGDEPQPPDPPSPDPESYRCDGLPVRPVRGADQ